MNRCTVVLMCAAVFLCSGCYTAVTLPIEFSQAKQHAKVLSPAPGTLLSGGVSVRKRHVESDDIEFVSRLVFDVRDISARDQIIILKPGEGADETRVKVQIVNSTFLIFRSRDKAAEWRLLGALMKPPAEQSDIFVRR